MSKNTQKLKKHGVRADTLGAWFWTQQACFDSAAEQDEGCFFACMDKKKSGKGSKIYAHFKDEESFVNELYNQDPDSRCMYELITKKHCCLYIDFDGEMVSEQVFMDVVQDAQSAISMFCNWIGVDEKNMFFVTLTSSRNDDSGRRKQSIHLIVKNIFFENNVANDLMLNFVLCVKKYIGDVSIMGKVPSGLNWQRLKTTNDPRNGVLLENDALEKALLTQVDFTRREWQSFGISNLSSSHFLRSAGSIYKPCGSREFVDKNVFTQNRAWRPPWGEKEGSGVPLLETSHGPKIEFTSELYRDLKSLDRDSSPGPELERAIKDMIRRGLVTSVPSDARIITAADVDLISQKVDAEMLGMFWLKINNSVKTWREIDDEHLKTILIDRQHLRRCELIDLVARLGMKIPQNSYVCVQTDEGRSEYYKPYVPSVIGFACKSSRDEATGTGKRHSRQMNEGEESKSKASCTSRELIPPYFRRIFLTDSSEVCAQILTGVDVTECSADFEKLPAYVKKCLDMRLCERDSIVCFYISKPKCCPYRALMDSDFGNWEGHKSNNARALVFVREDLRKSEEMLLNETDIQAGRNKHCGKQVLWFCNDAECRATFCSHFKSVPRASDFIGFSEIRNIPSIFRKVESRNELTPLQKIFMTPFYPHHTTDREDRQKFLHFIRQGYDQVAKVMAGKTKGQFMAIEYMRFLEFHGGWCMLAEPKTALDKFLQGSAPAQGSSAKNK